MEEAELCSPELTLCTAADEDEFGHSMGGCHLCSYHAGNWRRQLSVTRLGVRTAP